MVTLETLQRLYKQAQTEWTAERQQDEDWYVGMIRKVAFSTLPQTLQEFIRQTELDEQQEVTVTFSHIQAHAQEPPTITVSESYSFYVGWELLEMPAEKEAAIDGLNIHVTLSAINDLEITTSLGSSKSNARSNYPAEALLDTEEAKLFRHLEEVLKNSSLQDELIQGLVPLFEPSLV